MTWGIEFSSTQFLPTLPEQSQVNPGRYGFELALWLAQGLSRRGLVAGYPNDEEWAWFIEVEPAEELSFSVCCASHCDAGAGYDGSPVKWSVSIHELRSLSQRMHQLSHDGALETLGQHILALLREAQIEPEQVGN